MVSTTFKRLSLYLISWYFIIVWVARKSSGTQERLGQLGAALITLTIVGGSLPVMNYCGDDSQRLSQYLLILILLSYNALQQ